MFFSFCFIFGAEDDWTEDSCSQDFQACLEQDPEFAIDTDPQKAIEEDPEVVFDEYPEKAMEAIANGDVEISGEVKQILEQQIGSNPSIINRNAQAKEKWLGTYSIGDRGGEIASYNENTGTLITKGDRSTVVNLNNNLNGARIYSDGSVILPGDIGVNGGNVQMEGGKYVISSDYIDVSDASGDFIAETGSETNINGIGIQIMERTDVNVGNGYVEFDTQNGGETELYANGRKTGSIYGDFKLYDSLDFDLYAGSEFRDNTDYFKVSKLTQFRNNCRLGSTSCVENGQGYVKIYAKGGNNIEYGTSLETTVYVDDITDSSKVRIQDGLTSRTSYEIDKSGSRYKGGMLFSKSNIDLIVSKGNGKYEVYSSYEDMKKAFDVSGSYTADELIEQVSNPNSDIYTSRNTGDAIDTDKSLMPVRLRDGCRVGGVCQVKDKNGKIEQFELKKSKGGKELYCRVSDGECFNKQGVRQVLDDNGFHVNDFNSDMDSFLRDSVSFQQEVGAMRELNYNIGHVGNELCGRYVGKLCEKNGLGCSRQDAWTWGYGYGNEQTYDSRTGEPLRNFNGYDFNDLERSGQLVPGETVLVFYNPTSNWKHKLSASRCSSQGTGCGTHVALYVGDGKIAHQLGTTRYDETTSNGLDTVDRLINGHNYRLTQVFH